MLRFHPVHTASGLLPVLVLAAGLGAAATRPASALNVMLKVTEHTDDPLTIGTETMTAQPGQFLDLIATTDEDVLPPHQILVFDAIGTFLVGFCDIVQPPGGNTCLDAPAHCKSCKVPKMTQAAPGFKTYTAYVAQHGEFLFPPDIQGTSNDVHPSWLNPLKLYAWRPTHGSVAVSLTTDSGGVTIRDPYKIEFFRVSCSPACTGGQPGARVGDPCLGGSGGIAECSHPDGDSSAVTYQAILSQGGADLQTARNNDARAASWFKCVDPSDFLAPTPCIQKTDPLTGH
jgi:hypothetical protein